MCGISLNDALVLRSPPGFKQINSLAGIIESELNNLRVAVADFQGLHRVDIPEEFRRLIGSL
jgi:hypothetical protein